MTTLDGFVPGGFAVALCTPGNAQGVFMMSSYLGGGSTYSEKKNRLTQINRHALLIKARRTNMFIHETMDTAD